MQLLKLIGIAVKYLDDIEDEISRIFMTRIYNDYNRQHRDAVQKMINELKYNK